MSSSRRLQSFPPPDLEVVVGPTERIYRYHSFLMASYSNYVDTMLASNMKESETKHISFPDIEPELWEKMIGWLEHAAHPPLSNPEDIVQVLPLYDKYQFMDGIARCDGLLSDYFDNIKKSMHGYSAMKDEFIKLAAMSYNLNLSQSKDKAKEYASHVLKRTLCWTKVEDIKLLLPLVENDDKVLVSMVTALKGRHCRTMTMDEIRIACKEESFPQQCVARVKVIEEIKDMMRHVHTEKIDIDFKRLVEGDQQQRDLLSYLKQQYTRCSSVEDPGAMEYYYELDPQGYGTHPNDNWGKARFESMDPFGNTWEFVMFICQEVDDESSSEQEEAYERKVLYRWNGGYSSLVPPKTGWEQADDQQLPELKLTYHLETKTDGYF